MSKETITLRVDARVKEDFQRRFPNMSEVILHDICVKTYGPDYRTWPGYALNSKLFPDREREPLSASIEDRKGLDEILHEIKEVKQK